MPHEPPLHVTRLERGRYLVRSQRPQIIEPYLVDFTESGFPHGHCKCIDFRVRIEHPIDSGDEPPRWTCIHIERVRSQLAHAADLCELAGYPREYAERLIEPAGGTADRPHQ